MPYSTWKEVKELLIKRKKKSEDIDEIIKKWQGWKKMPLVASSWIGLGVETVDSAGRWEAAGVSDVNVARAWIENAGIKDPKVAEQWQRHGFGSADAAKWKANKFGPDSAKRATEVKGKSNQ